MPGEISRIGEPSLRHFGRRSARATSDCRAAAASAASSASSVGTPPCAQSGRPPPLPPPAATARCGAARRHRACTSSERVNTSLRPLAAHADASTTAPGCPRSACATFFARSGGSVERRRPRAATARHRCAAAQQRGGRRLGPLALQIGQVLPHRVRLGRHAGRRRSSISSCAGGEARDEPLRQRLEPGIVGAGPAAAEEGDAQLARRGAPSRRS